MGLRGHLEVLVSPGCSHLSYLKYSILTVPSTVLVAFLTMTLSITISLCFFCRHSCSSIFSWRCTLSSSQRTTFPISHSPLLNVHFWAWSPLRRLLLPPELPTLLHPATACPPRAKLALSVRTAKSPLLCPRPLPIQTAVFLLGHPSRLRPVPCLTRLWRREVENQVED